MTTISITIISISLLITTCLICKMIIRNTKWLVEIERYLQGQQKCVRCNSDSLIAPCNFNHDFKVDDCALFCDKILQEKRPKFCHACLKVRFQHGMTLMSFEDSSKRIILCEDCKARDCGAPKPSHTMPMPSKQHQPSPPKLTCCQCKQSKPVENFSHSYACISNRIKQAESVGDIYCDECRWDEQRQKWREIPTCEKHAVPSTMTYRGKIAPLKRIDMPCPSCDAETLNCNDKGFLVCEVCYSYYSVKVIAFARRR